jgi:hypothetical protein
MFKDIDYNINLVVGTPLVGWKCKKGEHLSWLTNAKEIKSKFPNITFFSSFEVDSEGLEPFTEVISKLKECGGLHWEYYINDGEFQATAKNRLIRIETGRNLIKDYSERISAAAVLFVDSDMILTLEIVEKLLEVDRPLVSVDCKSYGLKGKVVSQDPKIEEHWNTAGVLLVNYPAFHDISWSHNPSKKLSDDPAYQYHAERLGWGMTWVRKDIEIKHSANLVAVEQRNIGPRKKIF